MKDKSLLEKLMIIQQELKAPKSQYNSFGKYSYRSCEDILEAVKPILKKLSVCLILSDEIVNIGDRNYVKSTAILLNENDGAELKNTAYAREEETKKGMDGSQITGASSSYARKYALNGLFLIDDVKDSDTTNVENEVAEPTLEDAKSYVINFGKKHPGELLVDVYKSDYDFIDWAYNNRDDDYFKKCVDLLDKQKPEEIEDRLRLIVEFEKLVIRTMTEKEKLYEHYGVENNTEMTNEQLKDAINIMKSKIKE